MLCVADFFRHSVFVLSSDEKTNKKNLIPGAVSYRKGLTKGSYEQKRFVSHFCLLFSVTLYTD